jgi:hypothetical protein
MSIINSEKKSTGVKVAPACVDIRAILDILFGTRRPSSRATIPPVADLNINTE